MAEPKRGQSIEKELMDALKYGGIDKAIIIWQISCES